MRARGFNKTIQLVEPSIVLANNTYRTLAAHIRRLGHKVTLGKKINKQLVSPDANIVVTTVGYVSDSSENLLIFDEIHKLQPVAAPLMTRSIVIRSVFMSATPKTTLYATYKELIDEYTLPLDK